MAGKRKRYSAEFKSKVALEAIRGQLTIEHLAVKQGLHQTMMNPWKEQAVEGMATPSERAHEGGPEGLGLERTDVHAQHLASAVAVEDQRDDHRHRDDSPVLAHLHVSLIDPEIGPAALDRPVEQGRHTLVNALA